MPESRVTVPCGNSEYPAITPTIATVTGPATHQIAMLASFTVSSRARDTGTASRYRSVPVLASPATDSPATTATAIGKNSGNTATRAANATKIPLSVMLPKIPPLPEPPRPP